MKKKWRTKWRVFFSCIIGITAVIFIGNIILNNVVRKKFEQTLKELSPVLIIHYSSIHTNLFASSVSVDSLDISYKPDSSKHQHSLYFPHVAISGINFLKLVSEKNLSIEKIVFAKGEINLDKFLLNKKDTANNNLLSHIHIPFQRVLINHLHLPDINVRLHSKKSDHLLVNASSEIHRVEINSSNNSVSHDGLHFGGIECTLSNFNYPIDPYYTMRIKQLVLNSGEAKLHIDSVRIIPQLDKFEFGKKKGYQADRIELTIQEIKFRKLDVMQLLNKKLIADEIIADKLKAHVFRDRRLPRRLKHHPLPADYLKNIPIAVHVNTFKINNGFVVSEEFPKDGIQSGILKIQSINLSLSPLINHRNQTDPDHINMHVAASIMGSGKIKASFYMPLSAGKDYYIRGAIQNLDLSTLNSTAENLGKMHIESGLLNNLYFYFNASEEKATGKIVGEYHNLVIEKLKKDIKHGKKIAKLKTFFLKHFIIPKNKDKTMSVAKRTGKIDYKRDPTRFATFYFLKALLDGIRASFDLGFLLPQ